MSDPSSPAPDEPRDSTPKPDENAVAPTDRDVRALRYDANLQLILRRLADHQGHDKPPWWRRIR